MLLIYQGYCFVSAHAALAFSLMFAVLCWTGLVLVLTLFMAAASGLGGVPYFFVRSFSKEYSALASAVACGVMLAASFDLVHEGQPYGANMVILGVLIGESFQLDTLMAQSINIKSLL